mmetsp:Transcript_60920/g.178090  ORF Transcript_60920/g.178090 Transcript_60920/m.178090 type:complete len:265 (+) Transcript_60920:601-1395(+)
MNLVQRGLCLREALGELPDLIFGLPGLLLGLFLHVLKLSGLHISGLLPALPLLDVLPAFLLDLGLKLLRALRVSCRLSAGLVQELRFLLGPAPLLLEFRAELGELSAGLLEIRLDALRGGLRLAVAVAQQGALTRRLCELLLVAPGLRSVRLPLRLRRRVVALERAGVLLRLRLELLRAPGVLTARFPPHRPTLVLHTEVPQPLWVGVVDVAHLLQGRDEAVDPALQVGAELAVGSLQVGLRALRPREEQPPQLLGLSRSRLEV